jgi:coenzyme F420-reducing hydrogenase beta subunit
MNIESIKNLYSKCYGCEACFNVCPVEAIRMVMNSEGFLVPKVLKSCIQCGKCLAICPIQIDKTKKTENRTLYWAYSIDETTRMQSSSGGIFTEIANYIFSKSGIVVGASFDENMVLSHSIAQNENQLSGLRGSKYVQSRKEKIFFRVKKMLEQGKIVAFIGTPCEIHGLKNYLENEYENLFTIDFVCHGVPSPGLFKKTIEDIEKRQKSKIVKFAFREKINGWRRQTVSIYFSNGEKKFIESLKFDFYSLFLNNYILRESCYSCKYPEKHASDLTLGDYWHTKNADDKGVSIVAINTKKGQILINDLSNRLETGLLAADDAMACFISHDNIAEYEIELRTKFFSSYFKSGHKKTFRRYYQKVRMKPFIKKNIYYIKAIRRKIFMNKPNKNN